jgi:hypothetical protein
MSQYNNKNLSSKEGNLFITLRSPKQALGLSAVVLGCNCKAKILLVYLFIYSFLHPKREIDSAAAKRDKILIISCCLWHARNIKQQNYLWDPVRDQCTWD